MIEISWSAVAAGIPQIIRHRDYVGMALVIALCIAVISGYRESDYSVAISLAMCLALWRAIFEVSFQRNISADCRTIKEYLKEQQRKHKGRTPASLESLQAIFSDKNPLIVECCWKKLIEERLIIFRDDGYYVYPE